MSTATYAPMRCGLEMLLMASGCRGQVSARRAPSITWRLRTALLTALSLLATPVQAACPAYSSLDSFRAQLQQARLIAYYDLEPARAVGAFEAAEATLECMADEVPAADLAGFYLWFASVYLDLDREAEARRAIDRAAVVSGSTRHSDPALNRDVRLRFLETRDQLFLRGAARLRLEAAPAEEQFSLDGQALRQGQVLEGLLPGDHFLQRGRRGAWTGQWITLPGGGSWAIRPHGEVLELAPWVALDAEPPPDGGDSPQPVGAPSGPVATRDLRLARGLAIGLGSTAALATAAFLYEEALFQTGALIDPEGYPVADYRRHYTIHWVSGVAGAVFLAGTVGAVIASVRLDRKSPPPEVNTGAGGPVRPRGRPERVGLEVRIHGTGLLVQGTW